MNTRDMALIESVPAVFLSTINGSGFPSTRAMLNLRNKLHYPSLISFFEQYKEPPALFFTTNMSSKKIIELEKNNNASAYFCNPESWHGVMLQGKLEIVKDAAIRHRIWQNGWEIYYKGGAQSDDYAVLRLEPLYISSYYQLEISETVL